MASILTMSGPISGLGFVKILHPNQSPGRVLSILSQSTKKDGLSITGLLIFIMNFLFIYIQLNISEVDLKRIQIAKMINIIQYAPIIHLLRIRSSIDIDEQWVFSIFVKVVW